MCVKDHTNYMHRLTAFYAVNALLAHATANDGAGLTVPVIVDRLLSMVLEAAKSDPVCNVQFNAVCFTRSFSNLT